MRWLSFVFAVFGVLFIARFAGAQQPQVQVQVNATVETDRVELGDTLAYTLQISVQGRTSPSDPKPGSTSGFSVVGAGSSPMQMRMNMNGTPSEMNSLTTTWTLRAEKVGTFTLGPASGSVAGTRYSARPQRVTVVPRGQGGGQRQRGGGRGNAITIDPFGGSFGSLRGLLGMDDEPPQETLRPTGDPKLALDAPRGATAFLHATIDKTRAVVGEQVTLNVYLYLDPYSNPGRASDVHEANANDFVKRSLIDDQANAPDVGTAVVGGRVWSVKLIRKSALFPLRSGKLTIDPMSISFPQGGLGVRESEKLTVDVSDPPVAGRPPGYALGDVGDFSMQATVTPRAIEQGGAIGVSIELRGTGNLPSQLPMPVVPGVEWLEPTTREKVGAVSNDRFGGTRTFEYVVRLHNDGAIDLGEVRLPFYDADKRTYGVARASLGIVNVAKGETHDAGVEQAEPLLANMPKPRTALEKRASTSYLTDSPLYWAALFGSPLACVLAIALGRSVRKMRERRAEAAPSPERIAKARRAEAKASCAGDDAKAAVGSVARAMEASVLAATGVNLRGSSRGAAKSELEEAGVDETSAIEALDILRACEDARFSPEGVSMTDARELWARAEKVLSSIEGGRS